MRTGESRREPLRGEEKGAALDAADDEQPSGDRCSDMPRLALLWSLAAACCAYSPISSWLSSCSSSMEAEEERGRGGERAMRQWMW